MTKIRMLAGRVGVLLALGGCTASRYAAPTNQHMRIQVQAEADSIYNLVWLRTTVTNTATRRLRIVQQPDSVDLNCTPGYGLRRLAGSTPKGDSLEVCSGCVVKFARPRYIVLNPGAQRVTLLKVDLNYVFPRRFLDSLQQVPCSKFFNRTAGIYQLRVEYDDPLAKGKDARNRSVHSNTVTIYRKK